MDNGEWKWVSFERGGYSMEMYLSRAVLQCGKDGEGGGDTAIVMQVLPKYLCIQYSA